MQMYRAQTMLSFLESGIDKRKECPEENKWRATIRGTLLHLNYLYEDFDIVIIIFKYYAFFIPWSLFLKQICMRANFVNWMNTNLKQWGQNARCTQIDGANRESTMKQ